ncbi:alpha/beta fold hydrolase [Saccharothrix syringae]|uniref:alpha/beta fold hydrolase n=1 Tax=Saccharothrix syringae TaxID=103733 RepID=UPI000AFB86EE|nr:alpha/beta hydrolase [Saccharothrix syringae]
MEDVELPAGVVHYVAVGQGPPVVLLHGLLMDYALWDRVLPRLPQGFRYIRPTLPLGAHRRAMDPGADLTLPGQVRIVADFLEALGLEDATLVHAAWGGALFLTARGLDGRVARQVVLPCQAFDNFPPGGVRLPRVGWSRRLLLGRVARRLPDELVRRWTEPVLRDPGVHRDLLAYRHTRFDAAGLVRDTEALSRFRGDALVLWSPDNRVVPPAHGHRLAALMPGARYAEVPGASVLPMLDEPEAVARELSRFLTSTRPVPRRR